MKCVCRYEFKTGDMIHNVPVTGGSTYQILCDKCYEFYNRIENSIGGR